MTLDNYETRLRLVEYARDRLRDALQARGTQYDDVFEEMPRNLFPCGALFPGGDQDTVADLEEEYGRVSFTPTALGFIVHTRRTDELQLRLRASASLFYPTHPTHTEVVRFIDRFVEGRAVRLYPKYRRIPMNADLGTVTIPLRETTEYVVHENATRALQATLDACAAQARQDDNLFGIKAGAMRVGRTRAYDVDELRNAESYRQILDEARRKAAPAWGGQILYKARPHPDGGFLIEFLLNNVTPDSKWVLEDTFIGATIEAEADKSALSRVRLPEVEARDHRYNPWLWARGRNCDAHVTEHAGHIRVVTDSVPVYVQNRIYPRDLVDAGGRPIDVSFTGLATDSAVATLRAVSQAMQAYSDAWQDKVRLDPAIEPNDEAVQKARDLFVMETQRFNEGVELLASPRGEPLLRAFFLMNASFRDRFAKLIETGRLRMPAGRQPSWRLFQLVFIVSELPDLYRRATGATPPQGPEPTVLWFPTGGGKTEAYLGLVVLHAFWDRIRGKPFGVTAFAKFPLRMLSLQQFARVVAVMEHAEDLRQKSPMLENTRGEPFSVGYYAGGTNTLNLLDFPVSPDNISRRSSPTKMVAGMMRNPMAIEQAERDHNKVSACPMCLDPDGEPGRVETRFDATSPGFVHECRNCGRRLGLHLTDTEVLRRLPTFIIATIDKLARFATEPWGRAIFGEVAAKCARHGFLTCLPRDSEGNLSRLCPILDCRLALDDVAPNVDPVPAILIQDELHLLTETLGAFASHYETMMIEALARARTKQRGAGAWKIIGSTATIEGYQFLVRQLYGHGSSRRFPAPGPIRRESFYAEETSEPQRFVLGVRGHGMSHADAVMKVFLEYHRAMAPLFTPDWGANSPPLPPPVQGIADADRLTLARRYRTPVLYGINRNEVAQINQSFTGQLNPYCRRENLPVFVPERVANLTGDNPIQDIQRFLEAMESGRDDNYYQALTTTSLFGHGVDLNDLNLIVFRGMPHRIAEYIQAMSRVGRADGVPSLVVNVYNPNRERDASHFEAHQKYLELRDILIRNVPTTRFSVQALERTAAGLFLHQINYEEPPHDLWKKTTVDGARQLLLADEEKFKQGMRRRLGLGFAPDPESTLVKRQERAVEEAIARIRRDLGRRRAAGETGIEYASERLNALTSLRDTDETIPVYSAGNLRPEGN